MKITAIKTHKITRNDTSFFPILDTHLTDFRDKSILVIASKVISITQGRIAQVTAEEKNALIKKEADYYLPPEENAYNLFITIKNNMLNYSSGIDESNVEDGVALWPKDIQLEVNRIREYLVERFGIEHVGVIVTDMAAIPLQRGIIAGPIAYSGFNPLRDLTKTPDLFGRPFQHAMQGVLQGLAASAGVVMGEGANQTPLAVIEDVPFVEFQTRNPTQKELDALSVKPEQDLYGSLLKSVTWRKGGV